MTGDSRSGSRGQRGTRGQRSPRFQNGIGKPPRDRSGFNHTRENRNNRPGQFRKRGDEYDQPAATHHRKESGEHPIKPREAALRTLLAVNRGEHLDAVLDSELRRVRRPEDRNLATEICYGVLRWRTQLDSVISRLSSRPLTELDPWLRETLRIGIYQLLFLDRIPPHAAVAESVGLLPERPLRNFANGLLRATVRQRGKVRLLLEDTSTAEQLARSASLPLWWVQRLWDRLGPELAIRAARSLNEIPATYLRANTRKLSRDKLLELLSARNLEAKPCIFSPVGIEIAAPRSEVDRIVKDGLAWIQDEASQIIPFLVGPVSGDRIADLCAAPGGKSAGLALTADVSVVSLDRSFQRLERLRRLSTLLDIASIEAIQADARTPPESLPPTSFDRVLADPPCSAMGTLHRNPDARWTRKESELPLYAKTQLEILMSGWDLLKPGGRIVYSVCSLEPEETTGVARSFLALQPQAVPESARDILTPVMGPGNADSIVTPEGHLQMTTWEHHTDSFFAAAFRKR